MARIKVLDDVGEVQLLERVLDTLAVAVGAVLAGLEVDVGDEVGERVGLDDEGEGRVGLGLDDLGDGCSCQCSAMESSGLWSLLWWRRKGVTL